MNYQSMCVQFCQYLTFLLIASLNIVWMSGCSEKEQQASMASHATDSQPSVTMQYPPTPADFSTGEATFNTFCSACHGVQAKGTEKGPPLVHKIYEPNHHGDFAFQRAAAQGVRAHHWKYGNMPKVDGVNSDEVSEIIKYVRWLQREARIY